ncbi:gibberellin 20 oxidase 2-like [Lolium rigidum]|uniref:gibberellin 20 oxidase 2-like n=1 Tax=Lolium rigidum TaxID=89674 RepID=UPI001F5DF1EF|nr:gibberellin 20 oxidase 2-like [Lolium rigidum]
MVLQPAQQVTTLSHPPHCSARSSALMDTSPAPPLLLRPSAPSIDPSAAKAVISKSGGAAAASVYDLRREPNIPAPFVWPHAEACPTTAEELGVPVVDVSVLRNDDAAGLRRAVAQVASACATHGFFQVSGHGVDEALARAALESANGFFRLPLAEKQRARRVPGTVSGYTSAHADRFASKLPWKETLSFGFQDTAAAPVVVDYFTSTLGEDFEPMGRVYQEYCEKMKELSLTIMELLELSLSVERGYYREFFADSSSIMRCNYYPPCPEPERTLGTGPHCDPTALTILLQDDVGGLEVLVDGDWRPVRPVPGAMVINIGDTFMALSNGRYKSCLHRAVVNQRQERRSLAFFLCPRADRVVRPPPAIAAAASPRRYPDFTWADFMRFTQRHYRADTRTLDAFTQWLSPPTPAQTAAQEAA